MASNRFNDLSKASERKRDILTKEIKKDISRAYQSLYRDMQRKIKLLPNNATKWHLNNLRKELGKEIVKINDEILTKTINKIKEVAKLGTDAQLNFFSGLSDKYDLGITDSIIDMCTRIHTSAVAEILGGKIYKDRAGLSERLWQDTNRFKKDIDVIIAEGLAQKKGTYEIAKDLEKYVNPKYKDAVYNGVRGQANFHAYRIAHTSIIHAYQQAAKRSAQKNPYVEAMIWVSAHDKRTCELCSERNGKKYLPKDMPLDHPLGRCSFLYDIPMSLEDIGTELSSWRKGEDNKKLDKWFKDYGKYFV